MEFVKILKDIKNGNLPLSELPSFALHLVRESFWVWFALILGTMIGLVIKIAR